MNSIPFPHLHLHTEHSLLDSPLKLNTLIDFAVERGVSYLATTNHGNADDSVKLTQKCQEKGIHPIIGAELYIIHDGQEEKKGERRHLVVLVKEGKGFKNLMSMLTEGNINHFYYKPQIPLSFLYEHLDGLIVLSACSGGVLSWPDGETICTNLLDLKGEDFYLEAMPFEEPVFRQYFRKVSAVSDKLGIPLVATNDVHYLEPDGWKLHQVLINIGAKRRLKDPNKRVYSVKDLYFKTEKEMRMSFKEQDIFSREQVASAIDNAYKIAESCKFVLQPTKPALPIIGVPEGSIPYKQFKKLCWEGLKERGLEQKPDYCKRLEHEIEQIHHSKKGFSTYFLIVYNLQKWAKKEANILTSPCRGCFLPGQKVLLGNGERKSIESVELGDRVLNHFGEPDEVTKCWAFDVTENIMAIQFNDGQVLRCTREHKILTSQGWVEARKLKIGREVIRYGKGIQSDERAYKESQNCFIEKRKYSRRNNQEDCGWQEYYSRRRKALQHPLKSASGACMQNLQLLFVSTCEKTSTEKKWFCMEADLLQMYPWCYCVRLCLEEAQFNSSAENSRDSCAEIEKFPSTKGCPQERPYINSKENHCIKRENQFTRSYKAQSRASQGQNGNRQRLLAEISAKRFCEWSAKWNLVPIKFGACLSSVQTKNEGQDNSMPLSDSLGKESNLQARFLGRGQRHCRNKGLSDTYKTKDLCCSEVCREERYEFPYLLPERFGKNGSIGIGLDLSRATGFGADKKRCSYAVVKEKWEEQYEGKVYDLQVRHQHTYNIEGLAVHNSVGGSLVAYALGITEIDPLEYDLIFERFVSPGRIDFPDIDLDFEDERREEVHDYLRQTYGSDSVAHVSTFGKMMAKGALRDVSRYFDVPLAEVSLASKAVVQRTKGDVRETFSLLDCMDMLERAKDFKKKYPKAAEHAISLEGNLRNLGVHAAGIVLSPEPLKETGRCYLRQTPKGLTVNWDDDDLEYMGFVKFDILGLAALSTLAEARRGIEKKTGQEMNFYNMKLGDKKVLESLSKGDTVGIFQLGSLGIQKMIKQLGVDSFADIVAMNALHRPGALRTTIVPDYIARKHGHQKVEKVNPIFDRLTKETHGLILYQEQIMYLLNEMAGLPWKTADTIRKVVSKSEGVKKFMSFQGRFAKGCVKKGTMEEREATKMFAKLKNFGSYGFNKSHSTGYSMLAYYEAWCKTYYPLQFFSALMNHSSEEKIEEYVEDCRKRKVKVKLPSVHISGVSWRVDGDSLVCGLSSIKGLSRVTVDKIIQSRPFLTVKDFHQKMGKVSSRELEILMAAGAFQPWTIKEVFGQPDSVQLSFFEEDTEEEQKKNQRTILSADDVLPFREKSDLSFRNRGLIAILDKGLRFKKIGGIDFSQTDKQEQYYCGKMREVKYGYRDKIVKMSRQSKDSEGAMGGVYGNLQDDTTFIMLVFNPRLYAAKKRLIEEMEGLDIIALAYHHGVKANLFAQNIWRLSDIRQGVFDDLNNLNLIEDTKVSFDNYLSNCQRCSLHSSCKQPVQIESGQNNLMIVGEAPGYEEDREGRPFVGRTGRLLFNELKKLNFERGDFYLSNTVKCYPKGIKPLEQVPVCGEYLEMEIRKVRPIVILSLGNLARFFFTQKKSGIIEANGIVEWNDRFQAWIVYSIHPALLLHQPGNERLLEESLGAFKNLVKQLV